MEIQTNQGKCSGHSTEASMCAKLRPTATEVRRIAL